MPSSSSTEEHAVGLELVIQPLCTSSGAYTGGCGRMRGRFPALLCSSLPCLEVAGECKVQFLRRQDIAFFTPSFPMRVEWNHPEITLLLSCMESHIVCVESYWVCNLSCRQYHNHGVSLL
jgi:hypothetical protein